MRGKAIAGALLGFLPFVSLGRVGPIISFWPEWTAALLFWLLMVFIVWNAKNGVIFKLQPVGVLSLGFGGLLLVQLLLGMTHSVSAALMALWVLGFIFLMNGVVGASCKSEWYELYFKYWALGIFGALGYHFLLSILGFFGYDLVYFQIKEMDVPSRALGAFGQPNQLAVFSVLACWAASQLFLQRKLTIWTLGFVSAVATSLLVLSFSRAGFMCAALLGALLCVRPAWFGKHEVKKIRWFGMAFIGMGLVAYVLREPASLLISHIQAVDVSSDLLNRSTSNQSRIEQFNDGLAMGWAHPWLGVGYGRYPEVRFFDLIGRMSEANVTYPHNLLIHVFSEFGFFGLSLIIVVMFWVAYLFFLSRFCLKKIRGDGFIVGWLLVMFVYSMVEFPLMYLFFLLPTMLLFSVLLQGEGGIGRGIHVTRAPLLFLVFIFGVTLFWSAVDYRRVSSVFSYLRSSDSVEHGVVKEEAVRRVAGLAESSLFQYQATTLWMALAGVNPIFVNEKIDASRYLMTSAPTPHTIGQYVGLLLLARRDHDAMALLDSLKLRNDVLFASVLSEMRALSQSSLDLRVAMARHGMQTFRKTEP